MAVTQTSAGRATDLGVNCVSEISAVGRPIGLAWLEIDAKSNT
jgi:hypothetical protein